MSIPIKFSFSSQSITKSENPNIQGKKYLCGISSGMAIDAHNDRMSKECIEDFINQTQEKDVTLYVNHGKDFSSDIGILENSKILENGDWYTEYRLYDESDSVPKSDIELADKIWKQANGLPPYKTKRQFGFSIEGYIPDDKVIMEGEGKIIQKVDLDPGVSLVSKPAYTESVVVAIQKALYGKSNLEKSNELENVINKRMESDDFYESIEELYDTMESAENLILTGTDEPEIKEIKLRDVYSKFLDMRLELFRKAGFGFSNIFPEQEETEGIIENKSSGENEMDGNFQTIVANMQSLLEQLIQMESGKNPESENEVVEPGQEVLESANLAKTRLEAYKSLSKLLRKAVDEMDETEKAENPDSTSEDEEEMKSILKEVTEMEGATSEVTAEDEMEEIQPSDKQIDELVKSLGDKASAKTIAMGIRALQSKAMKQARKKSNPTIEVIRTLAKEIKSLKSGGQSTIKKSNGVSGHIGSLSKEELEKALANKVKPNIGETTIRENSNVMKSIFGGNK